MYLIYNAYSDNTADVLDLDTYNIRFLTEKQLINLANKHTVLGLAFNGKRIYNLISHRCISFFSETELYEYIRYGNKNIKNVIFLNGLWYYIESYEDKIPVKYYIANKTGLMVAKNKKYTYDIHKALSFNKTDAGKQAAFMNMYGKNNNNWHTLRVVCSKE